jgi:hypothetical protein
MEGWISQWYVNVPVVLIATGGLVAPGSMRGVPNAAASCVAVCAIESVFLQATVCPAVSVSGFGA